MRVAITVTLSTSSDLICTPQRLNFRHGDAHSQNGSF